MKVSDANLKSPSRESLLKAVIDELLSNANGGFVSRDTILETFEKKHPDKIAADDPKQDQLKSKSYKNSYGKAIEEIRKAVEIQGKELISRREGNRISYAYPEGISDLFPQEKLSRKRFRLGQLAYLVECSEGLFPDEWLHEFRRDLAMAKAELEYSGPARVVYQSNPQLKNLALIPEIFNAIKGRKVLQFVYNATFKEPKEVTLHPHCLKEYNQRWFVIGKASENGIDRPGITIYAIDRITDFKGVTDEVAYLASDQDYSRLFDNVVGVSLPKDPEVRTVEIRVHDNYTFGRILTKPLHKSQTVTEEYNKARGYATVTIRVATTPELITLLLGFGPHISVMSPRQLRDDMTEAVKGLMGRYLQ